MILFLHWTAKEDGLYFYRRITEDSWQISEGQAGWILYEIGYDQGEAVSRIMQKQ